MTPATQTAAIRFDALLSTVDGEMILRLPSGASQQLPSRGQVATRGTLDGHEFATVVEPDGRFGHWIKVDATVQRRARVGAGDTVSVELEPVKEWPEPHIPADLQVALDAAPQRIREMWTDITPMARWEWVRWVNETRNLETRRRRVEVTISKMSAGKRRPCCFNLAACTDPVLSRSGKLRESTAPRPPA